MPKHLLTVIPLTLALAGCGSDGGSQAGGEQAGGTITYGSFGTTADIDCADGKSLTVGGSNNTLKVTGTCSSVSIAGADNRITLARVDGQLSVPGLNNIVNYKSGDPDVNDEGSGNRISQG